MEVKIIPTGGLCNRMRAIASALAVAKTYGCHSTIYWNNGSGLKADFAQLFKPLARKNVALVENRRWLYRVDRSKDYLLRWPLMKVLFEQTVFNFSIYRGGEVYDRLAEHYAGSLLLISCYPMCKNYEIRGLFVPQDDIQLRIDEVAGDFTEYTIGVHIRRTDNRVSIQSSPLESFTRMMDGEIQRCAAAKFYVASDDSEVKRTLMSRYPGRIITLMEDASRNTLEGMKFAVLDLFCLARTRKIVGSVGSSYSQIAAEIGGIDVEYAK